MLLHLCIGRILSWEREMTVAPAWRSRHSLARRHARHPIQRIFSTPEQGWVRDYKGCVCPIYFWSGLKTRTVHSFARSIHPNHITWKDDLLRSRLREMLLLVRDVMMTKQGYLQLFFHTDWSHVSFRDFKWSIGAQTPLSRSCFFWSRWRRHT